MIAPVQLINASERHLGGRPTKRTPERENLLLLAIAKGLPLKAACKLAGLGFTTFNGWREEDSFFAQKIEFAEVQAIERNLALDPASGPKRLEGCRLASGKAAPRHVCAAGGPIRPARLRPSPLERGHLLAF
jgi:hypothetical protein